MLKGVMAAGIAVLFIYATTALGRPALLGPNSPQVLADHTHRFTSQPAMPDPNLLLRNINDARRELGLQPLKADPTLEVITRLRGRDMVTNGYYAHLSPSGRYYYDLLDSLLEQPAGYSCENLDLSLEDDPETYLNDWLKSRSGHRECVLNPRIARAGIFITSFESGTFAGMSENSNFLVTAVFRE